MTLLSNTITSKLKQAMRLVTVLCTGSKDAREATEISPYGWDSCPIPGAVAVYMDTVGTDNVIAGYVGKNQICTAGESRQYSTDTSGATKYFVYCKADKILIGTGLPVNHFTQYEALNTALQAQKAAINTQLALIQAGIAGVGGVYPKVDITLDITASKTTNILTN